MNREIDEFTGLLEQALVVVDEATAIAAERIQLVREYDTLKPTIRPVPKIGPRRLQGSTKSRPTGSHELKFGTRLYIGTM